MSHREVWGEGGRLFSVLDIHRDIGAAGDNFGLVAEFSKQRKCLTNRFGFKIIHDHCPQLNLYATGVSVSP